MKVGSRPRMRALVRRVNATDLILRVVVGQTDPRITNRDYIRSLIRVNMRS